MNEVLIITGSDSDFGKLVGLEKLLEESGVKHSKVVASCHRDLDKLYEVLNELKGKDIVAIIAVANSVSNMPAIVAGYLKETKTIVVGVGLGDKGLNGVDSLLSVNTIPKGVPLVNTGIGEVGLYNAGLFVIKLIGR